ncbi:helix-turn-helix domain-containing protein [Oerskovia sp. USHLN155]|uniref:helix-turn-helix domain-containing protein n=1 Tax=Oerskovia sp. USHLN155 TaxID=3081288 RepID=UPI003FA531AD
MRTAAICPACREAMTKASDQTRALSLRPLMSVAQLAGHLGVSERTVYRWCAERTGPTALRVGSSLRFRPTDVEAWLETRVPTDDPPQVPARFVPTRAGSVQALDDAFSRSARRPSEGDVPGARLARMVL